MNETIQHEIVVLPPQLFDLRVKLLTGEERRDGDARAKEEREGVVIGEAESCKHVGEEGESGAGFVSTGVSADEGIPEEGGGGMGEAAEEEEGMVEVDGNQ